MKRGANLSLALQINYQDTGAGGVVYYGMSWPWSGLVCLRRCLFAAGCRDRSRPVPAATILTNEFC